MKKIWLISYHLDEVTAGPSVRFQRYAPFFMEKGYRLVFVTLRTRNDQPDYEVRENFDVIRVRSDFKVFKNTMFLAKSYWKAIFSREKPATVLTFSITTFHLWLLPLMKLRGLNVIFVNTMSLHTSYLHGNSLPVKLYNRIHHVLYGILFRNIGGIVNSSSVLSDGFLIHKVPKNKLSVIYNGVNSKRFHPVTAEEKEEFRKKLSLPARGKIILFVGLKVERKGITDLLDTWRLFYKDHPEHYLVMVGDEKTSASDSDYNASWEAIKEEIKDPDFRVINRPNHPNIEEYFYSSDIFIFLSKKEGMPNVVLEAMASGLPMILTKFEGFSDDYGQHGEEYLLVERNPQAIADSLHSLCQDETLYKKIIKNELEKVQNDFLVESSIGKYVELFE